MSTTVRVRFAPSPSGILHLGNARTALMNYLFARQNGGACILRIDDTDIERRAEGSEDAIIADLKWLGLTWDEGPARGGPSEPYRQSDRGRLYENYLGQLLGDGHAYRCFCTPGELKQDRDAAHALGRPPRYSGKCRGISLDESDARAKAGEAFCLRFRMPERSVTVEDLVKGDVTFDLDDIGDFVIARSGGAATYNFASALDDGLMRVSHVIRGDDHLSNTPRQIVLMDALGLPLSAFAHLPLLTAPEGGGGGLSKRGKDADLPPYSLAALRKQGYLPEAVANYLFLMGGGVGEDGAEILSMDEMAAAFAWDKVGRGSITIDPQKLRWVNAQHIQRMSADEALERASAFLPPDAASADRAYILRVMELLQDELVLLADLAHLMEPFVADTISIADDELKRQWVANQRGQKVLRSFAEALAAHDEHTRGGATWDAETVTTILKETKALSGHKGRNLFMPIRLATCGVAEGPPLKATLVVLGYDRIRNRVDLTCAG